MGETWIQQKQNWATKIVLREIDWVHSFVHFQVVKQPHDPLLGGVCLYAKQTNKNQTCRYPELSLPAAVYPI